MGAFMRKTRGAFIRKTRGAFIRKTRGAFIRTSGIPFPMQAPRREPGDSAGRFGIGAALSPCLRMGAFIRKTREGFIRKTRGGFIRKTRGACIRTSGIPFPIQAPRREPGDNAGRFGIGAAISPCLRMGAFIRKTRGAFIRKTRGVFMSASATKNPGRLSPPRASLNVSRS